MFLVMMTTNSSLPILHQWKRKKANPAEFEGAGNMTKLAGYTTPIYNVVKGAMSGTQLLGDAIIALVKDYGKDEITGKGVNIIKKLIGEIIKKLEQNEKEELAK